MPLLPHIFRQPISHLQGLLVLAIALGGGGIAYGLRHMVIQLAALAILAANPTAIRQFVTTGPRLLVFLVVATVLLPVVQIVPLPPSAWQALPGRDLVQRSFAVSGIPLRTWFTLSVDPLRTLLAFCSTLVPASMIAVGWSLSQGHRRRLALTLGVCAGSAFLLGAVQLTSANTFGILQNIAVDPDIFYATFSNRNSTGMFFLICLLLAIGLPAGHRIVELAGASIAGSLFLMAVILTQSRTSMALLVVAIPLLGARLLAASLAPRGARPAGSGKGRLAIGALMSLAVVALLASLFLGGRVSESVGRFSHIDQDRLEVWDDGAFVAKAYWPMGSGTGTFDEVFQVNESLEYISPARAGRAHNDYVELAIESGVAGYAVLLGWMLWLGIAVWRRRADDDRWLGYAAWTSLVCIAFQSALDYPLRSEALLCIAGLLIVLLLPPRDDPGAVSA